MNLRKINFYFLTVGTEAILDTGIEGGGLFGLSNGFKLCVLSEIVLPESKWFMVVFFSEFRDCVF